MDFNKVTNQELLARLEKLTQTERKLTHVILAHINETESRRLYAELGYGSMLSAAKGGSEGFHSKTHDI